MGSVLSEQVGRMTKTRVSSKLILINVILRGRHHSRGIVTLGAGAERADRTSAFLPWDPPAREQVGGVLALGGGYEGDVGAGGCPGRPGADLKPKPKAQPSVEGDRVPKARGDRAELKPRPTHERRSFQRTPRPTRGD